MRYLASLLTALIASVLVLLVPSFSFAQESDGDPDLISYVQFSRMNRSDQDQYLEDLREALITLSTTPNRYGLPLVVENGFSTVPSGRAMAALTILNFLSEVAEAKACHDMPGNKTVCDAPGAPLANQQISPPPLAPFAAPAFAPRVQKAAQPVPVPAAKPVSKPTPKCHQFNGETFCGSGKPVKKKSDQPKTAGACPVIPKKDVDVLKMKYRSSSKTECIYGGYISHEVNKEGMMSAYEGPSAHGCRPVRQDQYEGQNFKCANAKQVLCNPLLFGLSGTGTAVCVAPQAHATRACGDQAHAESQKYGKAYQDFQTQFRQTGSVQDHWREFSSNLNKLCSDKDFGGVHCDECSYFHEKLKAAAARAKTLRNPPGVQPSAGTIQSTVG